MEKSKKILFLICTVWMVYSCNNYSSDPFSVARPLLLAPPSGTTAAGEIAITTYGNGHSITVAAQNTEPVFSGYRVFEAATESEVLNALPESGTDCGALLQRPVFGQQYTIEVRTDSSAAQSSTLCIVPAVLTSGNYVSIRTVYFAGILNPVETGEPSNALVIP